MNVCLFFFVNFYTMKELFRKKKQVCFTKGEKKEENLLNAIFIEEKYNFLMLLCDIIGKHYKYTNEMK